VVKWRVKHEKEMKEWQAQTPENNSAKRSHAEIYHFFRPCSNQKSRFHMQMDQETHDEEHQQ
jgi:hypothetical protein